MTHFKHEQIEIGSIELIIFDCDGVLVDSEVLSKKVLLKALAELDVEVSESYFDAHFLGHNFKHVTAKILDDFAVTLPTTFREHYLSLLMQAFTSDLTTTPHLKQMLARIKLPICVATSSSRERVTHALSVTGIIDSFPGCVFTCSEVKAGKPAPDIFLHAANTMGVPPKHCLVIEDSEVGIKAGLSANMTVVQYCGGSHLINKQVESHSQVGDVSAIYNWDELFTLFPSLNSSTL